MSEYILQEDGTSKILLEDGSGALLQEFGELGPSFIASATAVFTPTVSYSGTQRITLTTPGTFQWLCPAGVSAVYVECIGGGGPGGQGAASIKGGGGGGAGAYAARKAVPVTPGTLYTFVVGAAGTGTTDGGSSTFTGDSSVQVVADGGKQGISGFLNGAGGPGGAAASSTGDVGLLFNGGSGGAHSGTGGGGGASGDRLADGANGTNAISGVSPGVGGTGANGGGSGGDGGHTNTDDASAGSSPGGAGGGGGIAEPGGAGAPGEVIITCDLVAPFISSATTLYGPALITPVLPPFIASTTAVHAPTLSFQGFFAPFIASKTHVWSIFSLFDPNRTFSGPGNGGETFQVRLAPNGTTATATLAADLTATSTALELTGDGSFPSTVPFVVTIDTEVLYIVQLAAGSYRIRGRGRSNTTAASHTAGATVSWGDSYDLALIATEPINGSFTADINGTGSTTYPGWLICFDSSQAYLSGARYPMHVGEVLGVFDAGAGSSGTNRCDAAQPNAISTATGVSDDCPAALSNPARISSNISAGDVALVRYTNPEASALDLGPRSPSLQSWFGLKRVDATDVDVTFTDPNGIVVDTTGAEGTFTGSVNGEWADPVPLVTGIAPDASDAAGTPIDTPNPVPWTTVTLPGSDRFFTHGSPGYNEKGWPMCCLAVRQGNRRVPFWQSWDWHDYAYVYSGFGTDDTFAQILINRNGIAFDSVPVVELPGPQDIDGPDAVWDDGTYYFGASWYVVIFSTPYLVFGPSIGGSVSGTTISGEGGFAPGVSFGGGGVTITIPSPTIEGGSGGGINPVEVTPSLFQAAAV